MLKCESCIENFHNIFRLAAINIWAPAFKYLTISLIENVGIFRFLVGGGVGRRGRGVSNTA